MKTIIIKNLSTIKDAIVVEIVSDLMAEEDEFPGRKEVAEEALDLHRLRYRETIDRFRNQVTYTVTDDGEGSERDNE